MSRLRDRVAIVTGAGRGIGLSIAKRFAKEGAQLMICDLEAENLASAVAAFESSSLPEPATFDGNLAEQTTVRSLVQATMARYGRIDILVNNAGGGIIRPFLEHSPTTLRETVDRNLWTAIWSCYEVLPVMHAANYGRIINIGADSVRNGLVDHAAYNAAKGGVHGMTTGLAREFAKQGITVNTVAPCAIQTQQMDEIRKVNPQLIQKVIDVIPMGRPGTEDEVASMTAYLASEEAGFITGQVISVNGGTTML